MDSEAFPRGKLQVSTSESAVPSKSAPKDDRLFGARSKVADDEATAKREKSKDRGSSKHVEGKEKKRSRSEGVHPSDSAAGSGHGRADELSAKKIRAGITVLARIRRISPKQLVLSLPNGLTGYCKVHDVNEALAKAIGKGVSSADHDADDEDEGSPEGSASGLAAYFVPGQYVPATVLRIEGDASAPGAGAGTAAAELAKSLVGATSAKHGKIYVTLRPEVLNAGLTAAHMKPGTLVCGYVRSVEDHGYSITTGIEGVATAFLPFSASDGTAGQAGTTLNKESAGTPCWLTVDKFNKGAASVSLSCKAATVAGAVSKESTHTIHTLKPGQLVEFSIDKQLSNGLSGTFLGFFQSTLALPHLPTPATAMWNQDETYAQGKTLKARILYIDTLEKAIALSAAPHLVDLGSTHAEAHPAVGVGGPHFVASMTAPAAKEATAELPKATETEVVDGTVIEDGIVLRIDSKLGMLIGWGKRAVTNIKGMDKVELSLRTASVWGCTGYCHISRVADGARVESIEKLYRVGSPVRVRVLGFAGLEGVATLSAKPSVVNAAVLRVTDLAPGAVVEGTVAEVFLDRANDPKANERAALASQGKGLIATVKLGEGVSGSISAVHIADLLPTRALGGIKTRAKFLESAGLVAGGKIKARVLTVDQLTGKIQLTLKRTLLTSTAPAITSFQQVQQLMRSNGGAPVVTHGFVTACKEQGLIVTFYGNTHGLVPTADLVAAGVIPAEKAQKVAVAEGGTDYGNMTVPESVMSAAFSLGQVVRVRVARVQPDKARMTLSMNLAGSSGSGAAEDGPNMKGVAPQLADLPAPASLVSAAVVSFHKGKEGKEDSLLVKVQAKEGQLLYATIAASQLSDHEGHAAGVIASLVPGTVLQHCVVLTFTPFAAAAAGQAADTRRPLLNLSLKPLLLTAASAAPTMLPAAFSQLVAGAAVAGVVVSITVNGAFIRLAGGLTGLAPRNKWQKAADGVAAEGSSTESYSVGQSVLAVVDKVTPPSDAASQGRFTLSLLCSSIAKALPALYASHAKGCHSAVGTAKNASPAAAFLHGMLLEQELVAAAEPLKHRNDGDEEEDEKMDGGSGEGPLVAVPSRYIYRPGSILVGTVLSCNAKGAVVELPAPAPSALPSTATTLAATLAAGSSLPALDAFGVHAAGTQTTYAEGSKVRVCVLDVDIGNDMLQVVLLGPHGQGAAGAAVEAKGKKRKHSEVSEAGADVDGPLVRPCTPAGLKKIAGSVSVGESRTVTVLLAKKGLPYAMVRVEGVQGVEGVPVVGFLALQDFAGDDALHVKAGQSLQAVVTQVPDSESPQGGKGAPPSAAEAASQAVNSCLLLTAAPSITAANAQGNGKTAPSKRSSAVGSGQASLAISELKPGALITAILRHTDTRSTGADKHAEASKEGRARANSTASGVDEGEEGKAAGHAGPRAHTHAQPLRAHLANVRGKHSARITFAECVDYNPYTGQLNSGESPASALERYNKLLSSPEGTRVQAKVVSITMRTVGGASSSSAASGPAGKRQRSASTASVGDSGSSDAVFEIELTLRAADMALPDGTLASLRPAWSKEAAVQAQVTQAEVNAASPASLLAALHAASAGPVPLPSRGMLSYAVVEGLSSDGAHLMLSLGAALKARCSLLEAGNEDSLRDAATGQLVLQASTARSLSARHVFKSHPLGSVLPVVVMSSDSGHRLLDVSIRRAAKAFAMVAPKKKGSPAAFSAAAVAEISTWLPSADLPVPTPGRVTLGLITAPHAAHSSATEGAVHDETSALTPAAMCAMPALAGTAATVQVRLPSAGVELTGRGQVDITHLGERAAWGSNPAARLHQSDVVLAVALPPSVSGPSSTGRPHMDLSLRPSWIVAALAAGASKVAAGKTAKKGGSQAAPSAESAAVSALTALEDAERSACMTVEGRTHGYVTSSGERGAFVRVCRDVTARVQLSKVADHFIKDASAAFPVGKLVQGLVVSADIPARRAELSLKKSDVDPTSGGKKGKGAKSAAAAAAEGLLTFADLKSGMLFSGRVRTVTEFGVFVTLDGTDKGASGASAPAAGGSRPAKAGRVQPISGLVHVSEVEDEVAADVNSKKKGSTAAPAPAAPLRGKLSARFTVGDRVQVVVVSADAEAQRLSLSMKQSRIEEAMSAAPKAEDEEDEEESDGEEQEEEDDDDDEEEEDDEVAEDELDGAEDDDETEDDDDEVTPARVRSQSRAGSSASSAAGIFTALTRGTDDGDSDSEVEEDGMAGDKAKPSAAASKGKGGAAAAASAFSWAGAATARVDAMEEDDSEEESGAEGGSDEDSEQGAKHAGKSAARRATKRAAVVEEEETRRLEQRLASGEALANPQSKADFERLLTAAPQSLDAWVRYMAWQLSVTEVDGARAVAERALKSLPSSDEPSRVALWTAYLNLEATYGDMSTLSKVFARAQQSADPQAVHFALLGVYERAGQTRASEAEALFGVCAKKFGKTTVDLWARWAAFRMSKGDAPGARALLDQARKNLPAAQHGPVVVKFALLEYKHSLPQGTQPAVGSQERGRTLFESLLTAAPKRLDIWSVYLDQEIAAYKRRYAEGSTPAAAAVLGKSAKGSKAKDTPQSQDLKAIRTLFERLVSGKHSSKKMKFLLKKYAAFERTHGDATGLARVQEVATAYVQAQVTGGAGQGGEEEDEDME